MATWTTRAVAMLMLASGGALGTARACEAPRIGPDRMRALSQELGRGSFQMDPSTVIMRVTFVDPAEPPTVETVFAGGDTRYAEGIVAEARLLRSSCATSAAPVTAIQTHRTGVTYTVQRYRASEPRLKGELDLADVAKLIKDLKSQQVRFDFREMNCPFAVQFAPYRPYLPNLVTEIAQIEPSRAPFLAWLRTITLDIPRHMMVTAIGQQSLLYVPCAVLDLS